MTLRINLLGDFQVEYNDEPIVGFSTDKVRALFAYLAVEHNQTHHRQQLSTLLWPDQPDNRSRHNLRQALSNLRQTLPNPDYLQITSNTIQFQLDSSVLLDVAEFSSLAKRCEQHQHENMSTCFPCIQRQQKMLSLYQGEFLSQFPSLTAEPFEEWLMITREAFHQLAMQAISLLMIYHERRGDLEQALLFSKQITKYAPWNEEGYRQTMIYLAKQGKRSEALKEYERCKTALEKEFDIPPIKETQILAQKIIDNKLEPQQIPSKPGSPASSFIGREKELIDIADRLANPQCRLLTLVGAGGSGKTRLAYQCAEQHAGIYSDGIYFIPLANIKNRVEAIQKIGNVLNLQLENNPFQQICEYLQNKNMLLILDNFEHITSDCEILSDIVQQAINVKLLVTSRERLCLKEEWVYTIEGLAFEPENTEQDYLHIDAVQLFIDRARQAKHDFQVTEKNRKDIFRICELVEGFPLGIELAASTIQDQICKTIADTLSNNLSAISVSIRNLPERHRNLQAAFEHSWKLLSSIEKQALANLSIFSGNFSTEAAIAITNTPNETLANLGRRSMLKFSSNDLYGFHDVIHQFAREKCENPNPLLLKHAAYFAEFVNQIELISAPEGITVLGKYRADILAAWNWIINNKQEIHLLSKLLPAVSTIYLRIGPISDGKILFEETIKQLQNMPKQNELIYQLTITIGQIDLEMCEFDQVLVDMQSIIDHSPFVQQHAQAKYIIGQVHSIKGESGKANETLLQALTYSEEQNDLHLKMNILIELGRVSIRASEYELSMFYNHQALELAQKLDDQFGQAAAEASIGTVYFYTGKLQQANEIYQQALERYEKLKDRRNESRILNNLSNIIAEMGDMSLSLVYSNKALDILSAMGNEQRKAFVLHNLGATYWELGDYHKAKHTYLQALNIYKRVNIPHAAAEIFGNLALTEYSLGNLKEAKAYAELSIETTRDVDNKENMANAHFYLGKIEYQLGNIRKGKMILEQGLEIRKGIHHPGRIAEYYVTLAEIAITESDIETGIKLCNLILEMMDKGELFSGADDPLHVFYTLWKILFQMNDERGFQVLENGVSLLLQRADLITDSYYRISYLENVKSHHLLLTDYQKQQELVAVSSNKN